MKRVDLTTSVMKRVTRYEKARVARLIAVFTLGMCLLLVLFLGSSWLLARDLLEKEALAFLGLFFEDPEVLAEFWYDALGTFWQEVPYDLAAVTFLAAGALVSLWWYTRGKRGIVKKRLRQLEKYQR